MEKKSQAEEKKIELLKKMVHPDPENNVYFNEADFLELVNLKDEKGGPLVTFNDLRRNIQKIYDMNETSLLQESDPMGGGLSWMNRQKQKQRRKAFFKRIRHGKRTTSYKTIVAEGDSWFCFPLYVKDINEWLIRDEGINLYSIAAAGDWLTNIIYEGKYVEELSMIEPDVFMISGGGNDICGSNRLSFMINTIMDEDEVTEDSFVKKCITDRFESFLWTLRTQYWLLLSSLKKAKKLQGMKIITQGYDYVIPYPKVRRSADMLQWIINKASSTGDWLRTPLMLKGLRKPKNQIAVMMHLIDRVNEIFIWLANYPNVGGVEGKPYEFPNLYHIDCRLVSGGLEGWFDEIHLKSERFKIVAEAYKHLIFETPIQGQRPFRKDRKCIKATWFEK